MVKKTDVAFEAIKNLKHTIQNYYKQTVAHPSFSFSVQFYMNSDYYYIAHENCIGKLLKDRLKNADKVEEKDAAYIVL